MDAAILDENLIEEILKFPVLFEVSSRKFKDQQAKTHAWAQISSSLSQSVDWCQRRYRSLKRDYFDYTRGTKKPSGSPVKPTQKRLGIYARMTFLDKFDFAGSTLSNLPQTQKDDNMSTVSNSKQDLEASREDIADADDETCASLLPSGDQIQSVVASPTEARESCASQPKRMRRSVGQSEKYDSVLMRLTDQIEKETDDEYSAFGRTIGDAIRRLQTQMERDYAMVRLRNELFQIQMNGLPRPFASPQIPTPSLQSNPLAPAPCHSQTAADEQLSQLGGDTFDLSELQYS